MSAADDAEIAQLQAELSHPSAPQAFPHDAEIAQLQSELKTGTPDGTAWGSAKAAAPYVGKAMDYQRGAVGLQLDKLGGPSVLPPGTSAADVMNLASPKGFPSWRQGFATKGMPAGPTLPDAIQSNLSPLHMLSPALAKMAASLAPHWTPRDVLGTAADIVSDPLTYESGPLGKIAEAAGKIPYAGRVVRGVLGAPPAISGALKDGATSLYESGIRPIIQAGERYGNPNVGKTMLQEGISGSPASIQKQMGTSATRLGGEVDQIHQAGAAAGATSSTSAAYDPLDQFLKKAVTDRRLTQEQADSLWNQITEAKQAGPDGVSTRLMNTWKTDAANALPGSTFDDLSKVNPTLANKAKQVTRAGMQRETEQGIADALPDSLQPLKTKNQQWGDLINDDVRKAAQGMVNSTEAKPFLSTSDLLMAGMGAGVGSQIQNGHTLEGALAVLAAKKAIETARSTAFKTTVGNLGYKALTLPGASPVVDALSRNVLQKAVRPSPYTPQ